MGNGGPGWYPDPWAPGQDRYWDGSAWTYACRPHATGPGPQPGGLPPPPLVPSHTTRVGRSLAIAGIALGSVFLAGVVLAVVVFAFGGSTTKSTVDATARTEVATQAHNCAAELTTLEAAVEAYKADNGQYPTTIGQLTNGPYVYLRSAPEYHVLGPNGTVSGVGPCTGD